VESELNAIKENFHAVRQALNQDIDALKEREDSLKKTNALLEKGLEEQKRANLDTYGKAQQQPNQQLEKNLIMEERVAKAESEVEKLRAESINAIEMLKKEKALL
jgi:ribosome recycling factor